MQIIQLNYPINDNEQFKPCVLALGFFDGVHLGHQKVIKSAGKIAKEKNLPYGIMTFNPHPKEVMGITEKIDQITPLDSKLRILDDLGVDICYLVKFDKKFAGISPMEFIDQFLLKLNVKGVVAGFDFTFGNKGIGTPDTLIKNSKGEYTVEIIDPYYDNGQKISSTRIRDYLLTGNISDVSRLLGRYYSFKGKVIHGDKRGRTIGFPTANLELAEDYLDIKNGVYLVKNIIEGQTYIGVMNVGFKPTFDNNENHTTYEIFILNFSKEIYDKVIEVELLEYIRAERKFNSIGDLKVQIEKDVRYANKFITNMV